MNVDESTPLLSCTNAENQHSSAHAEPTSRAHGLDGAIEVGVNKSLIDPTSRLKSDPEHTSKLFPAKEQDSKAKAQRNDSQEPSTSPFNGVSRAQFALIFGGIMVGHYIVCFDTTIMASTHPVITSYFHSSNSASWLSTAFLLTLISFQPLYGRISDSLGRKPPYVFAMLIIFLSTIWCSLATSISSFIAARAVCGLGAGGMIALSSIITNDLVPVNIRGSYQSINNVVYGAGAASGAALGGVIADSLGWRWGFGIQLPFLLLCLAIVVLALPKGIGCAKEAEGASVLDAMRDFDWKGSMLLITSTTSMILGLASIHPYYAKFVRH